MGGELADRRERNSKVDNKVERQVRGDPPEAEARRGEDRKGEPTKGPDWLTG